MFLTQISEEEGKFYLVFQQIVLANRIFTEIQKCDFYCHLLPGRVFIIAVSASGILSIDNFVISLGIIDK